MRPSKKVWMIFGVVVCSVIIFSVQIFLTLRQHHGRAVSDEVTERSRELTEQVKETLEKNK